MLPVINYMYSADQRF